ncbi:hypothetical protein HOA93_01115 [bacterium]|nr:hypothetical protein [bacterium]
MNHLINTPTVNTNNYKYNVTSIEPGNEIKTPIVKEVEKKEIKEEVKVSSKEIKDQEIRDIFEEKKEPEIKKEENVTTGKEVKKIQASELYVKEKQISEEKQLWYK